MGLHLFQACDLLSRRTGLPLGFWLRLACSLADLGSLLLLGKILKRSGSPHRYATLLLVAISPVSIMVSGFHGNSDPVMVCLLLLSISLAQADRPAWLVGASFGLAMNIKVVPVIFAPVFLFYLRNTRERITFALSAAAVFIAGSLPYLAQDPALVIERIFGYTPVVLLDWGIPGLISIFLPAAVSAWYAALSKVLVLSILLVASFLINRCERKPDLFQQCACVAFLFLFFANGFGVQYLAWLVPWSAGVGATPFPFYYCVSSAFLFTVYTVWSRGFPWYAASLEYSNPVWPSLLIFYLEITCWMAVGLMARAFWRDLMAQPRFKVHTAK